MLNGIVYVANGIAISPQETIFFMSVALSATVLSCDTIDIDLVQDCEQLFACVRTSYAKIFAFSGAMEKWLSDLSMFMLITIQTMKILPALVAFFRKWFLIDAILIENFEKVRNDVIIAIVYKR